MTVTSMYYEIHFNKINYRPNSDKSSGAKAATITATAAALTTTATTTIKYYFSFQGHLALLLLQCNLSF